MTNLTINDARIKLVPDKTDFIPLWDTATGQQKKVPLLGLTNPGSIIHPGFKPGRWYPPHYHGDSYSSLGINSNTFGLCPFFCPREALFSEMAINVSSVLAAGLARLGIFELNTDITPGKILAQGEVSVGTTGLKNLTISLASPLLGWYGLAVALEVSSTLSINTASIPKTFVNGLDTPPTTNIYATRTASFTYASGAFTDNPTLTFTNTTTNPIGVWLKAA